MRIKGYGRGFSGPQHGGRERTKLFRRRYRVGDMLTGKLLRWEADQLGWVLIDDLTLLANIVTSPSPGDHLTFLVKSLTPDIVLQELHGQAAGAGGGGLSLTAGVQQFHGLRAKFESKAGGLLGSLTKISKPQRPSVFSAQLAANRHLLGLWLELAAMQAGINSTLKEHGTARFHYSPWLYPEARESEGLYRRSDKDADPVYHEQIICFRHRQLGKVQLRFLHRKGLTAYRVHLERQEHREKVLEMVKSAANNISAGELRLLGIERIHQYAQGGVLTELVSPNVHSISGFSR